MNKSKAAGIYASGDQLLHAYSNDKIKKTTLNESEQNMSSYHITRPVMNGDVS